MWILSCFPMPGREAARYIKLSPSALRNIPAFRPQSWKLSGMPARQRGTRAASRPRGRLLGEKARAGISHLLSDPLRTVRSDIQLSALRLASARAHRFTDSARNIRRLLPSRGPAIILPRGRAVSEWLPPVSGTLASGLSWMGGLSSAFAGSRIPALVPRGCSRLKRLVPRQLQNVSIGSHALSALPRRDCDNSQQRGRLSPHVFHNPRGNGNIGCVHSRRHALLAASHRLRGARRPAGQLSAGGAHHALRSCGRGKEHLRLPRGTAGSLRELEGSVHRHRAEVLSRILLMQPADLDAQCSSVASAAALARSARIGLIVVDTIGAHYRRARPSGAKDANALLRGQLDVLSAVAKETETMVLLTNQVFQRVEYGGVGIIGGAMLGQRCKCQVELQKDGRGRRAVLRRHPERQGDVSYDIAAEGIVAKRE